MGGREATTIKSAWVFFCVMVEIENKFSGKGGTILFYNPLSHFPTDPEFVDDQFRTAPDQFRQNCGDGPVTRVAGSAVTMSVPVSER